PFFSLYSKTGKLLFDAALPDPDMSYRAYVKPWVGKPLYPPSGVATTSNGQTTVYASWNGATQVKSWRVVAAGTGGSSGGPSPGSSTRTGFETAIHVSNDAGSYKVQALDGSGHVLGTSKAFSSRG